MAKSLDPNKDIDPSIALDALALEDAFERFGEVSARLEEKYDKLRQEAEALRRALEEKEQEVKRSERLAMLGEMAAAIAHEVRNPLGSIRLFASLLHGDLSDRPDSKSLVEQIEESVSRMDRLVSNILSFSKDENLSFVPINLHSIVYEQVDLYQRDHRYNTEIEALCEGNAFVLGNEECLRQVLHNLILNAIQAMKGSGKVRVTCTEGNEGHPCLCVRDNGPGVSEDSMPKLFDPFFTTRTEGTGLGLAIVKRMVEQHSASIEVHNDDGAVFEIKFKSEQTDKK